jgi:two-component system, LytTR family, response regulator
MRALIVDDEPIARRGVRRLLEAVSDVEVIGECDNGRSAIEAIESLSPDLVFLDIQMPELNGLEVAAALDPARLPGIIFLTAFDEYAVRAFDLAAIDYILKPIDEERFGRALARARARRRSAPAADLQDRLRQLIRSLEPGREFERRFVIRSAGEIRLVRTDDINAITAEDNYVRLHTDGGSFLLRETVTAMAERLDPDQFVRVRRSTLLRVDRIRQIHPLINGTYEFVLTDGMRVSSSRHYRTNVEALIGK